MFDVDSDNVVSVPSLRSSTVRSMLCECLCQICWTTLQMATQGLLDSKRILNIITTVPSQSVKLTVDTGGNLISSYMGPYEQGFVKVEVNTNYGTPDNTFQIVSADREKYEKIFNLPNTGSYNFDFKVTEQMDITYNQGGEVYLQIN